MRDLSRTSTVIEAPVGCVVCGAAADRWTGSWPYCATHTPEVPDA